LIAQLSAPPRTAWANWSWSICCARCWHRVISRLAHRPGPRSAGQGAAAQACGGRGGLWQPQRLDARLRAEDGVHADRMACRAAPRRAGSLGPWPALKAQAKRAL